MLKNSFMHDECKAWMVKLHEVQARVCSVVQLANGRIEVIGDPKWGIQKLNEFVTSERRASMDWVPEIGDLELMDKPMRKIINDHNAMKKFAARTLRHFIGTKVRYGTGECLLWEHRVPVDSLRYSGKVLKKKVKSPFITLDDVIAWTDFNIKSFGAKVSSQAMKIDLKWKELCAMIIEIGYHALKSILDSKFENIHITLSKKFHSI